MTRSMISTLGLLVLELLFVSSAFALDKGSLQLSDRVSVNGQVLPAGDYQVKWSGTGDVQLSFVQNGKVIATVPAHTIDAPPSERNNSTTMTKNDDGTWSLVEIHFSNKKVGFEVSGKTTPTQSGGHTAN